MEDQVHFLERWEWRKWAKIPSSNDLEALGINTLVLGVLVLNGNGQYQFLYNKQIDCIWQNLTGQLKKEEWEIRKREESREKVEDKRRKREKKHATHKGARTRKWKGSGVMHWKMHVDGLPITQNGETGPGQKTTKQKSWEVCRQDSIFLVSFYAS